MNDHDQSLTNRLFAKPPSHELQHTGELTPFISKGKVFRLHSVSGRGSHC